MPHLICDDVLHWAETYEGEPFHAMLLDPPYHLTEVASLHSGIVSPRSEAAQAYRRTAGRGFMGKRWDGGDLAFRPETWAALARHLLPGAFILAFASSRGWHRLACALEDAGLRIYPSIFAWGTGQSFPKATRIDTAVDKEAGAEREVIGEGPYASRRPRADHSRQGLVFADDTYVRPAGDVVTAPSPPLAHIWAGHRYGGQILKNSIEPIICAQVPYSGRVVDSITRTGAGALNIDAGRIGTEESLKGGAYAKNGCERDDAWGRSHGFRRDQELTFQQPSGRWPPNFALVHVHIPVMRLKGHLPYGIIETIRRFYDGYSGVSLLRARKTHSSVEAQGWGKVLQPGMQEQICNEGSHTQESRDLLSGVPKNVHCAEIVAEERTEEVLQQDMPRSLHAEVDRAEVGTLREISQEFVEGQDIKDAGRARTGSERSQSSLLEGRETHSQRGICLCDDNNALANPTRSGPTDGRQSEIRLGASGCDGRDIGETAPCDRTCPSCQRSEGRQSSRELGHRGQGESFAGASQDRCGNGKTAERECGLEVLARDIPTGWLEYFEPTGENLGCQPVGTRQVPGHKGYPNGRGGAHSSLFLRTYQAAQGYRPHGESYANQDASAATPLPGYASPEGTEIVPAWICSEGCPVRRLDEQAGYRDAGGQSNAPRTSAKTHDIYGQYVREAERASYHDSGSASRFFHVSDWSLEVAEQLAQANPVFYSGKASSRERSEGLDEVSVLSAMERTGRQAGSAGLRDDRYPNLDGGNPYAGQSAPSRNPHPTVKPLALARWLAALLLPPAAYAPRRLLVPFCGTGSEMIGAVLAGWEHIVGIEQDPAYVEIAAQRLAWWTGFRPTAPEPPQSTGTVPAPLPGPGQLSLF